jgi:hypothetical protein
MPFAQRERSRSGSSRTKFELRIALRLFNRQDPLILGILDHFRHFSHYHVLAFKIAPQGTHL